MACAQRAVPVIKAAVSEMNRAAFAFGSACAGMVLLCAAPRATWGAEADSRARPKVPSRGLRSDGRQPSGGIAVSQEGAVRRAVARSPVVRAARHGASAARARVRQARTAWLPRVKLQGGYQLIGPVSQLSIVQQVDPMPEPISITRDIGSLHNASVGLSVAWRAYDFGARDVLAKAAEAQAAAARAEGAERAAQVAYATRASYLATLFFEEMARVTRRSLQTARAEQRNERIKKKAGVGNDLDLARIQSRVADLEARLTRARQERARALTTLRILLGLPAGATLQLTDSLERLALAPPGKGEGGSAKHPSLIRLGALRRAARLQLKRQFWSYFPTLDVVGQVKYQYPKNFFETDKAGFAYMAGVLLTWNVFDGDLLRRQRAESRARIRQVESLQRATREEVTRKSADARAKVRIAQASAASARKMVSAADVYVRAARTARAAGTGTALEVRKAADALDGARLALAKAWFDSGLARAEQLLAEGRVAREGATAQKRRSNP